MRAEIRGYDFASVHKIRRAGTLDLLISYCTPDETDSKQEFSL